jgi:hypothetical protein
MTIKATDAARTSLAHSHCKVCGSELQRKRGTKKFCSDRCRKAAARAANKSGSADDLILRDQLMARGFIGQLWPVYRWDDCPRALGLLVPAAFVVVELETTEADLARVLRSFNIAEFKDDVAEPKIREFYQARKDRRVRRDEGLTRTKSGGHAQ